MNVGRRQRGIALLVALLVVALAAMLIAGLLDRGELALARTRNALRGEQAAAYVQGLEAYAAKLLLKDLDDQDAGSHVWASPLPPQQVPGGVITATLSDLNGCFNLNNLAGDTVWQRMFGRLLDARGVDRDVGNAVVQWLGGGNGADTTDAYYLAQPVPYRSAQRVFAHVSELRLVRGVNSDVYARLAPYVCALPPGTKLNVNTASVPVLQTLGAGITEQQAENLWQNGQAHWQGDLQTAWRGIVTVDPEAVAANRAGTSSTYFLAKSDIVLDGVPFTFFSLMERGRGTGIRVVERSRGSDDALVAPALTNPGGR